MEVNRLLVDELSYELLVRGLTVQGNTNQKRSALSAALKQERSEETSKLPISSLDSEQELEICCSKLQNLNDDIKHFGTNNPDNEYKRIRSKLMHVTGRIERIDAGEDEISEKCYLKTRAGELRDLLERIYNRDLSQYLLLDKSHAQDGEVSLIDDANPLLPEINQSNRSRTNDDLIEW